MAANGLKYEQQNTDPFYSATELWDDTSDPELSGKYYVPDHWISIMGCTEAYQYRVASTNATTDLNGVKNTSFQALGLTPAQQATLDRISFALLPSTAYATVAGQQGNALQAQDLVNNLLAPPLPSTQWQSEVIRWFETGLANIPQQIVNYPNNAWAQGRTAQPIVVSPRDWKGREVDALVAQCGHQRIRLVGSYLNFSFLGICIIASVSIVIVTLSFAMESILFKSKKWKANGSNWHKRVAHDADNKLNLLRQTLESRGYSDWQGGFKDVPVRGHADDHEMQVLPPRHDDDDLVRYPGRPHAQGGFRDEPVGQLDDDHDLQVLDHRRDYEAVRHQPVVHAQDAEQAPYLPAGQGQAPPDAGPAGAANASGSQRHNIAGHPVPSIVTQRGTYSDDEHGQGYQNLRARPGHNRQTSESHIGASYQADVLDEASSEQDANHLAQPGLARNPASQSSDAPLLGRQ